MRRLAALLVVALAMATRADAEDLDFSCPAGTTLHEHGLDAACETPAGVGEGPFWSRRPDHSLRLWGQAKHDLPHGTWIQFHPSGKKKLEAEYRDGHLNGAFQQWSSNGTLVYAGRHDAAGEMDGTWTRWWPNGGKRVEWEMHHGRTHGNVRAWWESGGERFRGRRSDGVDEGEWTWWDESGKVSAHCVYRRGKVMAGTCGKD